MKRSEALKQLSRDHHRALEAALKLRRSIEADAQQVTAEFLQFWRAHGSGHFRVEEDVLLPGAAPYVDPTDPAVVRVLTDHVEIRCRAANLEGDRPPSAEQLNALGELLSEHVRHEERVLSSAPARGRRRPPTLLEDRQLGPNPGLAMANARIRCSRSGPASLGAGARGRFWFGHQRA